MNRIRRRPNDGDKRILEGAVSVPAGFLKLKSQRTLNIVNSWCQKEQLWVNPLKTTNVKTAQTSQAQWREDPVLTRSKIPKIHLTGNLPATHTSLKLSKMLG